MTDPRKHAPADMTRIDVDHDDQVRFWCRELRVTPDVLRDAVAKAGPLTDDVKAELGLLSERG